MSLEERSFDLRQLVHGARRQTSASKAEEKGIALEVQIDERVPASLLGDPVKIGQVLTNLLGNAIKFTAQGVGDRDAAGPGARAPEAVSIDFQVADTGIGIAPDRLPHIFDEFTQANYDIGMKYGGTGLGPVDQQEAGGAPRQPASPSRASSGRGRPSPSACACRIPPAQVESAAAGEPGGRSLAGLRAWWRTTTRSTCSSSAAFCAGGASELDVVAERPAGGRAGQGNGTTTSC